MIALPVDRQGERKRRGATGDIQPGLWQFGAFGRQLVSQELAAAAAAKAAA